MTADTFRAVVADAIAHHDRGEITVETLRVDLANALNAVDPAAIDAGIMGTGDTLAAEVASVVDDSGVEPADFAIMIVEAFRRPFAAVAVADTTPTMLDADRMADAAAHAQTTEGITERVEQMYADARAARAAAWATDVMDLVDDTLDADFDHDAPPAAPADVPRAGHAHEPWMLSTAPDGSTFCGACGATVTQ